VAAFAFIHGAGDVGWYWHLVEAHLRAQGQVTVAPDMPVEDDSAGLSAYADVVVEALGGQDYDVVVGQSLGGYVAPIVAERIGARLIVLVAPMVPSPGESAEHMFQTTGWRPAQLADRSTRNVFYHDVPDGLADEALRRARRQSDKPGQEPWPLAAWPRIPTRVLLGRHDRFFPAAWLRKVVADRLALTPDELDSGHWPALSRPAELAARLAEYAGKART
jgi:pimeloyl-ACP methyl ester carboxylesterase